jgi:hypothetical protein
MAHSNEGSNSLLNPLECGLDFRRELWSSRCAFVSARPMFVVGNQIAMEVGVYLYSPLNFNHWSKDSWTNLLKDQTSQVEFEIRL